MPGVIATIVDTGALLKTVLASFVAGVGVTSAFALAILGTVRSLEFGREGRGAAATALAVLALMGFAAVGVAVVFAIVVMTSK